MAEFEITKKGNCLTHAHVAIDLKAYVRDWPSRIDDSHEVLCDDV